MNNLHQYAIILEHKLRNILECDRYGLGGVIDADFIEGGGMITAIVSALSIKYIGQKNVEIIDKYIQDIMYYNGKSFSEIGEETLIEIIDNFKMLYNKLD